MQSPFGVIPSQFGRSTFDARADDKPFAIKPVWMKHAAAVETGAGLTWFPKRVQFGFGVLPI